MLAKLGRQRQALYLEATVEQQCARVAEAAMEARQRVPVLVIARDRKHVEQLIHVLRGLVDQGNTVIVIEHQMDVIAAADVVVDLGPRGGDGGGRLVAYGSPEDVAETVGSVTGQHLRPKLSRP